MTPRGFSSFRFLVKNLFPKLLVFSGLGLFAFYFLLLLHVAIFNSPVNSSDLYYESVILRRITPINIDGKHVYSLRLTDNKFRLATMKFSEIFQTHTFKDNEKFEELTAEKTYFNNQFLFANTNNAKFVDVANDKIVGYIHIYEISIILLIYLSVGCFVFASVFYEGRRFLFYLIRFKWFLAAIDSIDSIFNRFFPKRKGRRGFSIDQNIPPSAPPN